jgi:hypothetical protein
MRGIAFGGKSFTFDPINIDSTLSNARICIQFAMPYLELHNDNGIVWIVGLNRLNVENALREEFAADEDGMMVRDIDGRMEDILKRVRFKYSRVEDNESVFFEQVEKQCAQLAPTPDQQQKIGLIIANLQLEESMTDIEVVTLARIIEIAQQYQTELVMILDLDSVPAHVKKWLHRQGYIKQIMSSS